MHQSSANAARDDDKRPWLWREGRRICQAQTWWGDVLHVHGMTVLYIVLYIMHKYSRRKYIERFFSKWILTWCIHM